MKIVLERYLALFFIIEWDTEMKRENYEPNIIELVIEVIYDDYISIIKTNEVGRGKDSKCIIIGGNVSIF